jgi:hypothetical protein
MEIDHDHWVCCGHDRHWCCCGISWNPIPPDRLALDPLCGNQGQISQIPVARGTEDQPFKLRVDCRESDGQFWIDPYETSHAARRDNNFRGIVVIQSRYYKVNGAKWEARFFHKGQSFPETGIGVPRQGVWARPVSSGWEESCFVGESWRFVQMDPDLLYFPD